MIKWLLALSAVIRLLVSLASNVVIGTSVATSLFVIGLLVIIAINVQPRKVPADEEAFDPDADLFEEFDDPYEEPAPAAPAQRPSSVRVKRRRKARV